MSFRVVRNIPGMIRIRIRDWVSFERSALEHRLRVVPGVCAVLPDPLTRSLVMRFDHPRGGKRRALELIQAVLRKCTDNSEIASALSASQ